MRDRAHQTGLLLRRTWHVYTAAMITVSKPIAVTSMNSSAA
jgi:hypothetical protein